MKKTAYFLIVLVILFTSCVDTYLDTTSPSQQSTENVFKSTFFTEAAMEGLYSMLVESTIYGQKISTNWPTNSDIEFAGLVTTPANLVAASDAGSSNYYSTANNGTTRWDNLYRLVEMSTTAVEGIRKSPLLVTKDSTLMKSYLGEALTLRSLAYFELAKLWGDIPFRKSNADITNAIAAKSDRDTIYKYVIKDLFEAQTYLPWMGKSISSVNYTAERVNKGFAKGLIAKVALFAGGWSLRDANLFPYQSESLEHNTTIAESNGYFVGRVKNYKDYYDIAAQQCAEIIGNKNNPHNLDDFENLWKTVNKLQLNTVNENLFEVAFGLGQNGDIGSLIGMNLGDGTSYGTRGLGGSNVKSSAYYFYSFDSLDIRRDITLSNISYTLSGFLPPTATVGTEGETMSGDPTSWNFAKWRYSWMSPAYLALVKASATSRVGSGINWVVMRYSDVLLMFAEAQNENNGADVLNTTAGLTARNALEKVRARAFKTHPEKVKAYSGNFFDAVVNERAWEFGGESLRKYDLIRWGLLSNKIEKQKEALCLMINGNRDVTIFDKSYPAGSLPTILFFKYGTGNTIDRSTVNWYKNKSITPDMVNVYNAVGWLSGYAKPKDIVSRAVTILTASTGLNASYDYSSFVQQMDSTNAIQNGLNQYKLGNGVCNYRHEFAIYYTEIQNSKGALKNSYGY